MTSVSNQSIRIALQMTACLFLALGFVLGQSQAADSGAVPKATPIVSGFGALPLDQAPSPDRSRTPTLTPTIVPVHRAAPREPFSILSLPGQPTVDANTVALYHLDTPDGNLAVDATGNYTGTLYGNASITTTGLYGGVLKLDGNGSFLRTGNVGSLTSGTIEAFVDFATACYGAVGYPFTIFSAGGEYGGSQQVLWLGDDGYLKFKMFVNGKQYWADSAINPCRYLNGTFQGTNFGVFGLPVLWPYETWRFHHVAGTWGPRGIEIWVDGVLHGIGEYISDPNNPPSHDGYVCSPQQQEVSPQYPNCNIFSMGLVPGSYGGGLPPYTTFLIGCNTTSSYSCFNGSIDEVRISSIQRIFSQAIDPTITPTPTQTPVPIDGAYTLDPQTTALYHLDSINYTPPVSRAIDATGAHNGILRGQAALTSVGRFGNAYYLDGNGSYFNIDDLGNAWSGAVEGWVNLSNSPGPYGIISARANQSGGDDLLLGVPPGGGTLRFGLAGAWAESGITPGNLSGCWHHVAGTWGALGVQVWVDGVVRGSTGFNGRMPDPAFNYPAQFGCDMEGRCMGGKIDEIRVSSVQRTYDPNAPAFAPVRRLVAPKSSLSGPGARSSNQLLDVSGTLTFLPFVGVIPTPTPLPCTFGS